MDLFEIENSIVKPTTHALLTTPYKEIWERDKDKHKGTAIAELSYIEFMCSYRKSNPFKGFPEDVREQRVISSLFEGEYIPDELVEKGIKVYKDFRDKASPTLTYYLASKAAAEKMVAWLNDFDMSETNPRTGAPLFKPREITSALKDTYDVMNTLKSLEEKVQEQIFESIKTKGNKEINPFEM